ncbi:MAG: right-handed parallel beta-helix repeat-containing protein [Gammaproteobacteria bacterium]|nr:right-handed parallel beta-helix repeat-containing protein [Gammaproteobacteria bacterium]
MNNSNGRTYVTVDHLTLRNCANNDCLITAGSGNFTAKFLTITNSNKHGIYCYACSSSSFLNNVIVANPTSGGTGGVGVYVFNVNNTLQSSDVTIDGNVITKAASSGIRIEGIMTPSQSCTTGCAVDTVNSKGWVLRPVVTNNDVSRSGNGVYVIGTQYAVTRGNRVHENDVAGQENYGLAGEICDQCLWEQNDSYLNARQGFESWSADTATGRQTGVVIRRNYIHDNNTGKIASACNFRLGHESGTPTNAGSNILIYANVLEGGCGMSIYDAFSGVVIANNHVLRADDTDSQLGGIFLVSGSSGTLQNNLVTAKKGYALLGSNSGNIGSWTHSTNHYYAPNSATPVRVNSVNYTDPKSWEASALTSDPTLVGGANAMGISASRLSPGSPDIGAGAVVGPYHDYLNHRFREPPSIGAFEQGSRSQAAARAARN